jgi:hypothetical protein
MVPTYGAGRINPPGGQAGLTGFFDVFLKKTRKYPG